MTHWKHHLVTLTCLLTLGATVAQAKPARQTPGGIPACPVVAQYAEMLAASRDLGLSLHDARVNIFQQERHASPQREAVALWLAEEIWKYPTLSVAGVGRATRQACEQGWPEVSMVHRTPARPQPGPAPARWTRHDALCQGYAELAHDLATTRRQGILPGTARMFLEIVPEGDPTLQGVPKNEALLLVTWVWAQPAPFPPRIAAAMARDICQQP